LLKSGWDLTEGYWRGSPGFQDGFPGEVPAVLHSTVRLGPIFLAYIALIPLEFLQIFVRFEILNWAISIAFILLLTYTLIRIADKQLQSGPITSWFSPRTEEVWLKIDEEDLVVRLPGKREAYRPTKLQWLDSTSFRLMEGKIVLRLSFKSSDDASKAASMVSTKFFGTQTL
jgi:hypothetical protein